MARPLKRQNTDGIYAGNAAETDFFRLFCDPWRRAKDLAPDRREWLWKNHQIELMVQNNLWFEVNAANKNLAKLTVQWEQINRFMRRSEKVAVIYEESQKFFVYEIIMASPAIHFTPSLRSVENKTQYLQLSFVEKFPIPVELCDWRHTCCHEECQSEIKRLKAAWNDLDFSVGVCQYRETELPPARVRFRHEIVKTEPAKLFVRWKSVMFADGKGFALQTYVDTHNNIGLARQVTIKNPRGKASTTETVYTLECTGATEYHNLAELRAAMEANGLEAKPKPEGDNQ